MEVNSTTNQIEWTYQTQPPWKFFSGHISGAQRLPNGNTLVCEGVNGRFFEVTWEGEVVWEYVNPFFNNEGNFGRVNMVFRAYRYSPDFSGFQGKELDPKCYDWLNHVYGTGRS